MFGENPIRPPVSGDGSVLQVQEIFPTVQGEGPRAGEPATFLRLGGCNLACTFCDTQFENFRDMEVGAIVSELTSHPHRLIVITGGEPLRQNIIPLCAQLIAKGHIVQIETNGTLWRELPLEVEVVCSPKNTGGGYRPLRADVLARARALKFIVSVGRADYAAVAEVGQTEYNVPVYVQPMDEHDAEKNRANHAHAFKLALTHGYWLSVQLHKILGVR